MKKSLAIAALTASFAFSPAQAQTQPYKLMGTSGDERTIALQACSSDGKTVRAYIAVIGKSSDDIVYRDNLISFWKTVAGRHTAKEMGSNAKAFKEDFNMLAPLVADSLKLSVSKEGEKAIKFHNGAVIRMQGTSKIVDSSCKPT